jgi:ArsR family transcriptional regulator
MNVMEEFVEQIKALGDKTRLKILWLLSKARTELCICEIMDTIGDSHSNVSRHLKILKTAKLVQERKEGRWVYVHLVTVKEPFHEHLLQAVSSIPEDFLLGAAKRLTLRLALRDRNKCVDGLKSEKWMKALQVLDKKGMSHIGCKD